MEAKDLYGETPLDNALHFKHTDILKLLEEASVERSLGKHA